MAVVNLTYLLSTSRRRLVMEGERLHCMTSWSLGVPTHNTLVTFNLFSSETRSWQDASEKKYC